MAKTAVDLQQLTGVGKVLAERLCAAGLDSFAKIARAGEEGLKKVNGLNPRAVGSILEQAKRLAQAERPPADEREQAVTMRLAEVREKIQSLAQQARERFQQELSGRQGKKLSCDLIRMEEALERISDGGSKRIKRAGKALVKADKRISGLDDASLKKLRKGLQRARKSVLKVVS